MGPSARRKMASFEALVENAVKPGPDRVIPGCACVAINKDGVFYEKSFGTQSVDPDSALVDKPFAMDTTMWIASCTKLMTAISVMQCVERRLLDLDADVSTILPEWKDAPLLKGFEEGTGKPIIVKAENKITLRHLLTHSAGLGYIPFDPRLQRWAKHEGLVLTDDSSLHEVAFSPLLFEPGESWVYGVGLEWGGQMVSRVNNNQPLGDYMQQHIWTPLAMNSTSFRIAARDDIRARRADMTMRHPQIGALQPSPSRIWSERYSDDHGGAGVFSCAADYVKVLAALLKNDGTLLREPTSVDALFAPCLSNASKAAFNDTLYAPYPGNENGEINYLYSNGVPRDAGLDYALGGFVVERDVEGRRKRGSLAWSGMANLFWVVDRESGLALFYASQLVPPGDRASCDIFGKFEEAVYAGQLNVANL